MDNTIAVSQLYIDGYSKPYRLDRNRNGAGIIMYVREGIPNSLEYTNGLPNSLRHTNGLVVKALDF